MKKIASLAVCVAALSLVLSGCINDRFARSTGKGPISFDTSIGDKTRTAPATRASGTAWGDDDAIGVYMIATDGTVAENSLAENVKHSHTGDGIFAPAATPTNTDAATSDTEQEAGLYYPEDGSAVDFVAYYPHTEALTGHGYPVDVADQGDPAAIDFMYSEKAAGYSKNSANAPFLKFHHKLVKLIFNVTDGDGAFLEELTATITGLKTAATFDLSEGALTLTDESGGDIEPILTEAEEANAVMEAIVLPHSDVDLQVTFTLADETTATLPLTGVTYLEGKAYTYNITISSVAEEVTVGGSQIVDWEDGWDEGDTSGDHEIVKTPAGDGDDDDDDDGGGGTPSGEIAEYYLETFGYDDTFNREDLAAFIGWASGHAGVTYTDSGPSNAAVNRKGTEIRMLFPIDSTCDVTIAGLPANYTDITFSCDLATTSGGGTNPLRIFAGDTEVTPSPAATIKSGEYTNVSATLPDGTTSIRLLATTTAINGIGIDNIRLEGRK